MSVEKDDVKATRLGEWCDFLSWRILAASVMAVFRENQARFLAGSCPDRESSEEWTLSSTLRKDVHTRVRADWMKRTGLAGGWWPYNEDVVARLYLRFRKRNDAERESFEREIATASLFRKNG